MKNEEIFEIATQYFSVFETTIYASDNGNSVDITPELFEFANALVAKNRADLLVELKPVAYLRARASDNHIFWSEDCVCEDAVYPADPEDVNDFGGPVISLAVAIIPKE